MRNRRLAWWLVWLYPPAFRREVGLSFVDALDDQMRAADAAGASRIRAAASAIKDTLENAPAEWVSELRHRSAAPHLDVQEKRTMGDVFRQDVRYALRTWRRRPAFALVAVLTLALGIAATTAMFSIVNAVLLRAIPYRDADRLVMLWGRTQANPQTLVSYREYDAIRRDARAFDATGLWLAQSVNLTGGAEPQRVTGAFVTGSFFDVLGLTAERGRLFRESESEPGSAQPVVVITHAFWQRRFGGDPAAIGATLTLNGTPLTVVGILASPFDPSTVPAGGWFLNCDALIPVGHFPGRNDLSGNGP
ncbi:MAG TPA: ABC transporter permease, partial [Vicinamibacterales bacterium]